MAAQPPRRRWREQDALLALALVLLLRCLLDTWDAVYYPLPFVLALLAWEVGGPARNPPVLALAASVLVWISFQWLPAALLRGRPGRLLPGLVAAARGLARPAPFLSPSASARAAPRTGRRRRAHEMTVSALGRLVRTS